MTFRRGIATLTVLFALGACAGAPFVDRGEGATVDKKEDTIRKTGQFIICFAEDSPATMAEVEALAREQCAAYGYEALLVSTQRYQCRLLVPHRATYRCVDEATRGAGNIPAAPAPAAVTPAAPVQAPVLQAPAVQAPADAGGGFTLEPGSWGRAFGDDEATPAAR